MSPRSSASWAYPRPGPSRAGFLRYCSTWARDAPLPRRQTRENRPLRNKFSGFRCAAAAASLAMSPHSGRSSDENARYPERARGSAERAILLRAAGGGAAFNRAGRTDEPLESATAEDRDLGGAGRGGPRCRVPREQARFRRSRRQRGGRRSRSEEHTSELQSRGHLVCRLLLEKKKKIITNTVIKKNKKKKIMKK